MSKIRYIYYNVALIALMMLLAACSSNDDVVTDGPDAPNDGMSKVTLRIGTADSRGSSTRATWQDNNATNDEMMNIWVVVIADASNKAEKVFACKPSAEAEREIDVVAENIELPNGTHHLYSFANMSVAKVKELLGITTLTMDEPSNDGVVVEAMEVSGTINVDNVSVAVAGNNFKTGVDNGFGSTGIPMSNKQTVTISENGTKDLIVIRMLAKIQLQITNNTGADVTLKNICISGITCNPESGKNNLMLLPKLTSGADDMEANHGDIQPNLSNDASTAEFSLTEEKTIANNAKETIDFYINESAEPKNSEKLFELTLTMNNGEYRYAVIDNSNDDEDDNGKWNYIARNDYRIIPITLDDYKLELVPYDFPPIGVLPVSVRTLDESKNLYEMIFHDYGHFHLVPKVTKMSDNSSVPYNAGGTDGAYWTLNTDWANSWLTYDTFGGTLSTDGNPGGFYVVETTPSTVDGSENGDIPVLDTQTTWNGFSPFIFGNIAKPSSDGEKSVYHEFKVKLHTPTYERYMIYRFNMVLSADRMLSPAKRNALSHRPH
ncbi:MAG: hypothetical protein J6B47_05325 [Prevotella sp.]|nr:hypothetical protein [Prevotella sp.]